MKRTFMLGILLSFFWLAPAQAEVKSYISAGAAYSHWNFHYDDTIIGPIFQNRQDVNGTVIVAGPSVGALIMFNERFGMEGDLRVLRAYQQSFTPVTDWQHNWFANVRGNATFHFIPELFAFGGLNLMTSIGTTKYDARHFGIGYQLGMGRIVGNFLLRAFYERNGKISLFADGNSFKGYGFSVSYLFSL